MVHTRRFAALVQSPSSLSASSKSNTCVATKSKPTCKKRVSYKDKRFQNAMNRKLEEVAQEEAFKELLSIRCQNSGQLKHGDLKKLIKTYHDNGYKCVTRDNLNYRLRKNRNAPPSSVTEGGANNTYDFSSLRSTSNKLPSYLSSTDEKESEDISSKSKGGRPKGSTKSIASSRGGQIGELVLKCSRLFMAEKVAAGEAPVKRGTLERIVSEVEKTEGLPVYSISRRVIRKRVFKKNLDGTNATRVSPISELEPIIGEFCIKLAPIGEPLTKSYVI